MKMGKIWLCVGAERTLTIATKCEGNLMVISHMLVLQDKKRIIRAVRKTFTKRRRENLEIV